MGSGFSTADKKVIIFTLTKQHFTFTMKIALCFLAIVSMTLAVPTPQRVGGRVGTSSNSKNGNNSPNTRFFTGNQAIDSAAFGAAAGVAGNCQARVQVPNPLSQQLPLQRRDQPV